MLGCDDNSCPAMGKSRSCPAYYDWRVESKPGCQPGPHLFCTLDICHLPLVPDQQNPSWDQADGIMSWPLQFVTDQNNTRRKEAFCEHPPVSGSRGLCGVTVDRPTRRDLPSQLTSRACDQAAGEAPPHDQHPTPTFQNGSPSGGTDSCCRGLKFNCQSQSAMALSELPDHCPPADPGNGYTCGNRRYASCQGTHNCPPALSNGGQNCGTSCSGGVNGCYGNTSSPSPAANRASQDHDPRGLAININTIKSKKVDFSSLRALLPRERNPERNDEESPNSVDLDRPGISESPDPNASSPRHSLPPSQSNSEYAGGRTGEAGDATNVTPMSDRREPVCSPSESEV